MPHAEQVTFVVEITFPFGSERCCASGDADVSRITTSSDATGNFIAGNVASGKGYLTFRGPLAQSSDCLVRYRLCQPVGIHAELVENVSGKNNNLRRSTKCFQLFTETTEATLVYFPATSVCRILTRSRFILIGGRCRSLFKLFRLKSSQGSFLENP